MPGPITDGSPNPSWTAPRLLWVSHRRFCAQLKPVSACLTNPDHENTAVPGSGTGMRGCVQKQAASKRRRCVSCLVADSPPIVGPLLEGSSSRVISGARLEMADRQNPIYRLLCLLVGRPRSLKLDVKRWTRRCRACRSLVPAGISGDVLLSWLRTARDRSVLLKKHKLHQWITPLPPTPANARTMMPPEVVARGAMGPAMLSFAIC